MLERAGYETGYDLGKLIEIGNWASELLGKRVASSVARAGGFPQPQSEAAVA
jgi:hydroxymethylglutaryl-CoA lyase